MTAETHELHILDAASIRLSLPAHNNGVASREVLLRPIGIVCEDKILRPLSASPEYLLHLCHRPAVIVLRADAAVDILPVQIIAAPDVHADRNRAKRVLRGQNHPLILPPPAGEPHAVHGKRLPHLLPHVGKISLALPASGEVCLCESENRGIKHVRLSLRVELCPPSGQLPSHP